MVRFQKMMAGHYRVIGNTVFAHISHDRSVPRHRWKSTIRNCVDAKILRYAGLWPTLREARAESTRLIKQIEG